ncbi:transcription factor ILR3-like [Andrographis paniculata]|uniref:transcription factor ILR3-like n=1 Tax=Andrographis paniculata TaxID=175694 RepID=UPI0021E891BA|nr:transcription factor ILR3-like [Andrographis paniculata]
MVSPETATTTNWLYDYGFDDIPNFSSPYSGFSWPLNNTPSNVRVGIEGSFGEKPITHREAAASSNKRARAEPCPPASSKACKEKQRRDRLNDKFTELSALLEPGRPPKIDKSAILVDAARMVTQLRDEAQKLKDLNVNLRENIKELKAEKNELRDEKQKLRTERENLEKQVKTVYGPNPQPGFLPPPPAVHAAFAAQSQASSNKLMPFIGYPSIAMWQFMSPAAVDTSEDHILRPPVA